MLHQIPSCFLRSGKGLWGYPAGGGIVKGSLVNDGDPDQEGNGQGR